MNNIYMDLVYLLVRNDGEWEDNIIILSKENAINTSIKYKNDRIYIISR